MQFKNKLYFILLSSQSKNQNQNVLNLSSIKCITNLRYENQCPLNKNTITTKTYTYFIFFNIN